MKLKNREDRLPNNRFQQVLEIIRERYFDIITLSILVFCFTLPLISWIIYVNFTQIEITNLAMFVFVYAPFIPGIMIFGLGMAGAFYFAHRIIHILGASPGHDLITGIRKHYRAFLLIYLLIGILYFLCELNQFWILANPEFSNEIEGVFLALNWFIFFVFIIFTAYIQTHIIIYQASLKLLIINSLRFTFGRLGFNVLMIAFCFLPFIVYEFIPVTLVQWIALGIAGLFYFAFSTIAFTAYSYELYDKFINQKQFIDIYRKGLKHEDLHPLH